MFLFDVMGPEVPKGKPRQKPQKEYEKPEPKKQGKPEGFMRPVQNDRKTKSTQTARVRKATVLDGDLMKQLDVLKSSTATEEDKIGALNAVAKIFRDQGSAPTLTQEDTTTAITTVKERIFYNANSTETLLSSALGTIAGIFRSNAPKSQSDAEIVFDQLCAFALSPIERGVTFIHAAVDAVNAAIQVDRPMTSARVGQTLDLALTLASNKYSEYVRDSAVQLISAVFFLQGNVSQQNVESASGLLMDISLDKKLTDHTREDAIFAISAIYYNGVWLSDNFVRKTFDTFATILNDPDDSDRVKRQCVSSANAAFFKHDLNGFDDKVKKMIGAIVNNLQENIDGHRLESWIKQSMLAGLGAMLEGCANCGIKLNIEDVKNVLSVAKHYLNDQTDETKDAAMQAIQAAINQPDPEYKLSVFDIFLRDMSDIANGPNVKPELKEEAGGIITNCCFILPEMFDYSEYKFFNLDSSTAREMDENSPDWKGMHNYWLVKTDYKKIWGMAQAHKDEPIIKTIFELTKVTYYGAWPMEILEHQYYNKDKLSGLPLWYIESTTHREGYPFGDDLSADFLNMFDIRICQRGTDQGILDTLKKTADRLWIKPKSEDPTGRKFKCFSVEGHGSPEMVGLKTTRKIADRPNTLDLSDAAILQQIGDYYQDGVGYLHACSTAGAPYINSLNIDETVAQNTGLKMWGAQKNAGASKEFFGKDDTGEYTLLNVDFGVPGTSYDYRNPENLSLPIWTANKAGGGVQLEWQATNKQNTESYEVERSVDGKIFKKVAFIPANIDGTTSYRYDDYDAPANEKAYYRIKQRNVTPVGTNGSKDYTFAISDVKSIGSATGIKEDDLQKPAKFALMQNYPNPFNANTTISYSLPKQANVTLKIYDVLGREVRVLADNERQEAGAHQVSFDALGLASGTYFYEIKAGKDKDIRKMLLVK